jgi:hypothetical protein
MGFDEFPVMVSRWSVTGGDSWGSDSPGWIAIGDVKQLQQGEKTGAQAIEKMVKPPMIAPTNMRTVKASILPGDINYDNTPNGTQGFRRCTRSSSACRIWSSSRTLPARGSSAASSKTCS